MHFWSASRDTLVERNTIIDCARGIGFGLGDGSGAGADREYDDDPSPGASGYVGHHGGLIRNNWISISEGLEYFDTGIELEQAHGARVLHNTLLHPTTAFASIAPRFANTSVSLVNNLMVSLRERDDATVESSHNSTAASADLFVNATAHDLRLSLAARAAIDQGETVERRRPGHRRQSPRPGRSRLGRPRAPLTSDDRSSRSNGEGTCKDQRRQLL